MISDNSQSVSVTHVLAWTTEHTHSRGTQGINTHEALCAFSGKGITTDKRSRPREQNQNANAEWPLWRADPASLTARTETGTAAGPTLVNKTDTPNKG